MILFAFIVIYPAGRCPVVARAWVWLPSSKNKFYFGFQPAERDPCVGPSLILSSLYEKACVRQFWRIYPIFYIYKLRCPVGQRACALASRRWPVGPADFKCISQKAGFPRGERSLYNLGLRDAYDGRVKRQIIKMKWPGRGLTRWIYFELTSIKYLPVLRSKWWT